MDLVNAVSPAIRRSDESKEDERSEIHRGGRAAQVQNYTTTEHKFILSNMKSIPGCYSSAEKSTEMAELAVKLQKASPGYSRSKETIHAHITDMKRALRSGIKNLSTKPEEARVLAPSYSDDFITKDENQAFFNALYIEMISNSKIYFSKAWWDLDVVKQLCDFEFLYLRECHATSIQTAASINEQAAATHAKHVQDRDNHAAFINEKREKDAKDEEDAKRLRLQMAETEQKKVEVLQQIPALLGALANPDNAATERRLGDLETNIIRIEGQIRDTGAQITRMEEQIKENGIKSTEGFAAILSLLGRK